MNEQKPYRAIPIDGKDFVFGWYQRTDPSTPDKVKHYIIDCCGVTGTALALAHTISDFPGYHEVIPETVGQATGLKDKNDKDLDWWEGDIFARSSDRQIEGLIIFDMGCFWLDRNRGGRTLLYECVDWSMCVIGTIHTHPELIKK